MRYSKLLIVGTSALLMIGGCFDNKNNQSSATNPNPLNQEVAPPPLDRPDQITADTRYAAGQLAESQGALDSAISQYREGLRVNPKHQLCLYRLGILYTQSKQFPVAIDTWKQYIRVTNGSPIAYSNAAFCYELAGRVSEAEDCYKQGIKKDPSNQPCRVNYGLMLARLGRTSEATAQLSAVLKPAEVHYNLASVYEQIGKTDEARAEYDRALQLDPKMWEAQARLSKLE